MGTCGIISPCRLNMRLNDSSFVFCSVCDVNIHPAESQREHQSAAAGLPMPSKSKQAAKRGHGGVAEGSPRLILLGKQLPWLSQSDSFTPSLLLHMFELWSLIGFIVHTFVFNVWKLDVCVCVLTPFQTQLLRSLQVI